MDATKRFDYPSERLLVQELVVAQRRNDPLDTLRPETNDDHRRVLAVLTFLEAR